MTIEQLKNAVQFSEEQDGNGNRIIEGRIIVGARVTVRRDCRNDLDLEAAAKDHIVQEIIATIFEDHYKEIMDALMPIIVQSRHVDGVSVERLIAAITHLPPKDFWEMWKEHRSRKLHEC